MILALILFVNEYVFNFCCEVDKARKLAIALSPFFFFQKLHLILVIGMWSKLFYIFCLPSSMFQFFFLSLRNLKQTVHCDTSQVATDLWHEWVMALATPTTTTCPSTPQNASSPPSTPRRTAEHQEEHEHRRYHVRVSNSKLTYRYSVHRRRVVHRRALSGSFKCTNCANRVGDKWRALVLRVSQDTDKVLK